MNLAYNADTFVEWVRDGDLQMIKLFLQAGMDPNVIDGNSNTALILAALTGPVETVKSLLEKDADVNAKDKQGNKALSPAKSFGRANIADLLLNAGANE